MLKNLEQEANNGRVIETIYCRGKLVVKRNLAAYANSGVLRCVDHMQRNSYQATVAEVFNNRTGKLHAVVRSSLINGEPSIVIVFKSEVIGALPKLD